MIFHILNQNYALMSLGSKDMTFLFFMDSAHGLGTAALSAKEPEALPFCAIAYALTVIFGSLLCSVPAVRQSLLAVVG